MNPILKINGINKEFSNNRMNINALADIHINVNQGEFVCLLGPSGCGKTTLLRIIAGLEQPTAGAVYILGKEVFEPSQLCGMVFQEPRLFPWLTVLENIAIGIIGRISNSDLQKVVCRQLELIGLADFALIYPRELSGGMAQRVAIARALAIDPELLLLDEPFSGLDAITRKKMQEEIIQLWRATGKTMIMVTHDIDEAINLGQKIVVFSPSPGRIINMYDVEKAKRQQITTNNQSIASLKQELLRCLAL